VPGTRRLPASHTRGRAPQLTGTALELFSIRHKKEIPCDTLELKDQFALDVAWEPTGSKLAVVATDADRKRQTVAVYALEGGKTTRVGAAVDTAAATVHWSPRGQFCVVLHPQSSASACLRGR
jgi:uncharacterized protein with WD repeat